MRIEPPSVAYRPSRRRFLEFGAYSVLAAAARQAQAARVAAAGRSGLPPIRSCVLLIHYGGPSHLDTWDPKPDAPDGVRGEFRPIATNVPGRTVSEHLPHCARIVDKLAVVRSLHHPMTNHNAAMYEALVGRHPAGGDNEILGADRKNDFPCYGSALSYLTDEGGQPADEALAHVALPHVMWNVVPLPGQTAGFLDPRFDPLQITKDPSLPEFRVEELSLPADLPAARLADRVRLLDRLRTPIHAPADAALESYRQRALELLSNARIQEALDIEREPPAARDRYGRHKLGQSLLLARRLVEAGVSFVNVNDKVVNAQTENWDSHENCFARHKNDLLPPADQAFSAFVEDLAARGHLDSTLVIAMGEFGRTPKINAKAGRDHWPHCYSAVLAGGGVAGGAAIGTSDRLGAYPDTLPVTPGDLAATLFWRFGLDPRHEIHDSFGRPFRLAAGEPVTSAFI
jgi:uncharacterized protein (DUF1501 family)